MMGPAGDIIGMCTIAGDAAGPPVPRRTPRQADERAVLAASGQRRRTASGHPAVAAVQSV